MDTALRPWLVTASGTRHEISGDSVRIGRSPENEILIAGSDAASAQIGLCERASDRFRHREQAPRSFGRAGRRWTRRP